MELKNARFAVVFFRIRPDNKRRERVFRYMRTFVDAQSAARAYLGSVAGYKVMLAAKKIVCATGDASLVERWILAARGANRAVDPFLAPNYGFIAYGEGRGRVYTERLADGEFRRWFFANLDELRRHRPPPGP